MTWVWAAALWATSSRDERIAVHGVDAPVAPDHLGQGHRDVAAAGADVEAAPAGTQAEPVQRGDQRPPVDVVAQTRELAHGRVPSGSCAHGSALYGGPGSRPSTGMRAARAADSLLNVKVTMLLCDAAQVSDGKLYSPGGRLEHDRSPFGSLGGRP